LRVVPWGVPVLRRFCEGTRAGKRDQDGNVTQKLREKFNEGDVNWARFWKTAREKE
jgi:hypothetical protein